MEVVDSAGQQNQGESGHRWTRWAWEDAERRPGVEFTSVKSQVRILPRPPQKPCKYRAFSFESLWAARATGNPREDTARPNRGTLTVFA